MNLNKRIRTVLYNDQRFTPGEIELLHTPAFQRLYDLHQLGLTDRVFVDASHSRLHHVVGVVEQAGNLMTAIARNLRRTPKVELNYSGAFRGQSTTCRSFATLVVKRIPAVRLMGLLHDLTHAPYGHTLEDEIHLVHEKHDEPKRQADAFYRVALQFFGWLVRNSEIGRIGLDAAGEQFQIDFDKYLDAPDLLSPPEDDEFIQYVADRASRLISAADERRKTQPFLRMGTKDLIRFVKDLSFAMRATLFLEAAHKPNVDIGLVPDPEYAFDRLFGQIFLKLDVIPMDPEAFVPHRDAFMLDVIGNTICADLLDYAKRDSVSAGLKLDYDASRIIENFTLVSYEEGDGTTVKGDHDQEHPFANLCIRTAISIFGHKLRLDVPGELLNLLQVRYYVYERMLFHPTKCIAGAMLGSAIQLIGWKDLPKHIRFTGDAVFLHDTAEAARLVRDYLASLATDKPLDDEVARNFEARIIGLNSTSVAESCRELLASRIYRVRDAKVRLAQLQLLPPFKLIAPRILAALGSAGFSEQDVFTKDMATAISTAFSGQEKATATEITLSLVSRVGQITNEISAGLHLLSRLTSRQYCKSVFRLLPEATPGLSAKKMAETFLDSRKRFLAEREIERRSEISLGSVVIHCPRPEGPAKIANILITSQREGTPETKRLREIGELHPGVFTKHEAAVKALEEMYQSTWRLVVSVAPPNTVEWKKISDVSARVLCEIARKGDETGEIAKNDENMIREIQVSRSRPEHSKDGDIVRILDEDGDETEILASRLAFIQQVGGVVESHELFRDVFEDETAELVANTKYERVKARLEAILDSKLKPRDRSSVPKKRTIKEQLKPGREAKPVIYEAMETPVMVESETSKDEDIAIEVMMSEVDRVVNFYRPFVRETALVELSSMRGRFQEQIEDNSISRAIIVNRLRELIPPLLPDERVECNRAEVNKIASPLLRVLASKT